MLYNSPKDGFGEATIKGVYHYLQNSDGDHTGNEWGGEAKYNVPFKKVFPDLKFPGAFGLHFRGVKYDAPGTKDDIWKIRGFAELIIGSEK